MAPAAPAREPMVIAGVGTSLAARRRTPEQVASLAGLDAGALRLRVGFEGTAVPERDTSPWHLGVEASRAALADAGAAPADLDLVLTAARMRMEYLCWALSLAVQKELGATRAVGVDLTDYLGGSLLAGVRILKAKFAADPRRRLALLAAPQRLSDMVDPARPRDQWLAPLGDGAGAVVVRRGGPGMVPLGHAFASEGRGSPLLATESFVLDEGPQAGEFYGQEWALAKVYTLQDGEAWYQDYKARALRLLPAVVGKAVERSGLRMDDVALVQAGFLYPEVAEGLAEALGLGRRVRTLNAHGHLGGAELAFALQALRADGALRGKAVVLAGAGFPAHAGALVLRA